MPLLLRFYLFVLALLGVMFAAGGRSPEMRARLLTLIVLLHIVVLALWLGPAGWTAVAGVIAALAGWELAAGGGAAGRAGCAAAALAAAAAVLLLRVPAGWVAGAAWLLAAATLVLPGALPRHPAYPVALAALQVGPCAAVLARLGWSQPPAAALALILLVQCNDAFAYVVGRRLGRRHLFPAISPNKSLEGYAAGAAAAALGVVVLHTLIPALPRFAPVARGAVLLAVAVAAADAGDLAVSALKRHRGVKDSGSVLPGHGGALDRFGNILLAAPLFALLAAAKIV